MGLFVVGMGLFLGGCTVTSFLGRQYTNFTAYYNKFHNATTAFEKGRESIEERDRAIDRTQYVSVFLEPGEQVNESPFDEAIQKSADVLREHPDSKWVDDALLLIGKSYFYQQNYVGAAQKFREAMALEGGRPQEARFWLARTLVATERYETAAEVIRTGIEGQDEGPWMDRLHLVQGQLLARQERWDEAVQALNRGLEGDLPDEVAARAAFLLGQTLETIGRPGPARAAYRQVRQYDPVYALDFAARLNDIELQGTHDDPAEALDRLRDLETDEKNYEQRGEMAVVRARIYRAQGRYDRARLTLRDMLYREEAPSGASRGRLHYDLARLYRDAFKDFSQAAAHFDTASTALGSAPAGGDTAPNQRMPTAPVDAQTQADRYRDLAERARTVARLDSLLRLGRMSEQAFQEYVAQLREQRRAEQEAQADEAQSRSRRLQSSSRRLSDQRREEAAPAADTRSSDAGFLFYKDPARVQRGQRQFEQTWGDRPLVDNWRRQVAIRSMETASSGDGQTGGEGPASSPSGAGPEGTSGPESSGGAGLDLSAVPRDSASLAEMEDQRTVARYKLANSLFLAASRPDSAATWYRRILQESGNHPVAKRALYALAEAYRAQGDSTAAQQAYGRLVEQYPSTDLAERARRRLDRVERPPANNRQAQADSAYARAYTRWQEQQDSALAPFLAVASRYPDTDAAPRALLAAGVMYWRIVQRDSAEAPRQLLRRHVQALQSTDSTLSDSIGGATGSGSVPARGASDTTQAGRQEERSGPNVVQSRPERPPDTLRAKTTDSTGAPPVLRSRPSDSIRVGNRTAAGVQATEAVASVYAPLEGLMTHLTERYPDAPQVERARTILKLVEEQRAQASGRVADTAAVDTSTDDPSKSRPRIAEGSDTTMAADAPQGRPSQPSTPMPDSTAPADTTAPADQSETTAADNRSPLPAPTGRRTAGEQEREETASDIDRDQGGWTLLVETFSDAQEASVRVADVGRRLGDRWPVELLRELKDGTPQYRLVVGQFESEQAAVRAQKKVGGQLAVQPQVWALSKAGPRP